MHDKSFEETNYTGEGNSQEGRKSNARKSIDASC